MNDENLSNRGRVAGSINKRTEKSILKAERILEEEGVEPIRILAFIANADWKKMRLKGPTDIRVGKDGTTYEVDLITVRDRLDAAKELAGYVHAKLKSVEVRTETPMTMESRLVIDMGGTPVAVASNPTPTIEEKTNDQEA